MWHWWENPQNRFRSHRMVKWICLILVPIAGWIAVWEDWAFKVITVILAALSVMYGAWAVERIERYRMRHPDNDEDDGE